MYLEFDENNMIIYQGSDHILAYMGKRVLFFGTTENRYVSTTGINVFVGTKEECEQEIENLELELEQQV